MELTEHSKNMIHLFYENIWIENDSKNEGKNCQGFTKKYTMICVLPILFFVV